MSAHEEFDEMISTGEDLSGVTSTQVLKRVNALLKLDDDHTEVQKKLDAEIREIEKKYKPQFDGIYEKRASIVSGKTESEESPKEPLEIQGLKSGTEKGIPAFWYRTLLNHPAFGDIIGEEDDEVLSYLNDITITEDFSGDSENQGFVSTFHFGENPFFTNNTVVMTLTIKEGDLESIKVTPIEWKEGKKFFVRTVEKKIKKKGPKGKKPTTTTKTVTETIPSIFSRFFVEIDTKAEPEEEDEEAIPPAQLIYLQYQAIISLKDDIIPDAVNYFLGRAEPEGMEDYGDEDFGEDFDDDMEEDEEVPQLKKKGSAPVPPPNNPECKQQ